MQTHDRPVFLNLLQIRLPIAGFMSILHRAGGLLLFLLMPVLLYLLDLSLRSPGGFAAARDGLASPWVRAGLFLLLWALLHHLLAGVRYLLLDIHLGIDRPHFRQTAWLVVITAPLIAGLLLGALL